MKTIRDIMPSPIADCIPVGVACEIGRTLASLLSTPYDVFEVRLRVDRPASLTVSGRNVTVNATVTSEELDRCIRNLCHGSLYAHAETIREGYINLGGGYRAGVCGRGVSEGGRSRAMSGFSSLVLRIPHDVRGCADVAAEKFIGMGARRGLLIYSVAGVGKTTLLRDLACTLSSPPHSMRVAVVDTRGEFSGCGGALVDILEGYPRGEGIELATRTLSPEVIICDELGDMDEARRIVATQGSGIPLVASCHAGDVCELISRPQIKLLCDVGCFGAFIGIKREGKRYRYPMTEHAEVLL